MSRRASVLAVLSVLLLASCGGRSSGGTTPRNSYTTQVQGYLNRLAGNARNQGYTRNAAGPAEAGPAFASPPAATT